MASDARLFGPDPLARRLESQLGLDLGLAGALEGDQGHLALSRLEYGTRAGCRLVECAPRLGGSGLGLGDPVLGVGGGLEEPLGVRLGGLGLHTRPIETLGALRQLGVEGAERGEGTRRLLLGSGEDLALFAELEPAPLEVGAHLVESCRRTVTFGDELDAALGAPRPAPHDVAADDRAVGRDDRRRRGQRGECGLGGPDRREIFGDEHLAEQREHARWGGHDVGGRDEAIDPWLIGTRRGAGPVGVGERELHTTELAALGVLEGAIGGRPIVDEHRVGEGAERRGDRGLEPRLHPQRLGEEAPHSVDPCGDEGRGPVLLPEGE